MKQDGIRGSVGEIGEEDWGEGSSLGKRRRVAKCVMYIGMEAGRHEMTGSAEMS